MEALVSVMRWITLALSVVLGAAPATAAQSLTVSAAISMKDAVSEIGRGFAAARPGVTLRYNWGSSGELQKQIEAGAPSDVFISAAQLQMDELEKRRLIVPGTRRVFARNLLTVIKPADSSMDIVKAGDLAEVRVTRIAMGNPKTVPAGRYAEESLRALGVLDRVRAKLIFVENVRQALDYVARGEVDAGFVYTTDAAVRGQAVKEAFRPSEDTYGPVVYPAAVVAGTRQPALAQAFVERLTSREGQATLARFGFQPPPAAR